MQPETNRRISWFGLLMIAIVSGLVIKIVGDPLVKIISPRIEDVAEDAEDFVDDQNWGRKLEKWLKQLREESE
jgi:hypothetical protein